MWIWPSVGVIPPPPPIAYQLAVLLWGDEGGSENTDKIDRKITYLYRILFHYVNVSSIVVIGNEYTDSPHVVFWVH